MLFVIQTALVAHRKGLDHVLEGLDRAHHRGVAPTNVVLVFGHFGQCQHEAVECTQVCGFEIGDEIVDLFVIDFFF